MFGESNEYVVGTKNFKGTKFCFKYITINALIGEYRICLYGFPVTPFSRKDKLVNELLSIAEKWFKIGFSADSKVLNVVEKHGLKYIAPMEKT
ncbi:MAG: hypothetical protein QXE46_02700 [Candidatus Thermoplasmatota archaeon]